MSETSDGKIRAVAWADVFPWLCIVRAFRTAIALRALVFGAMGIFLTVVGWGLIGAAFNVDAESKPTAWLLPYVEKSWQPITDAVPDSPTFRDLERLANRREPSPDRWSVRDPMFSPWALLSLPAMQGLLHNPGDVSWSAAACLILCGLWGTAVWAFFGGAISRIAVVRLAADEQVGFNAALRYAARKGPSYFAAPLLPVGGALLIALPVFILGLLMRTNPGLLLGGVLWPLALAAGFLMAVLLLGALVGWPLMWGAISAEGTDSFDALSRSYAYVFQRPLRYLFYVAVAAFLGWLGWIFVQTFSSAVIGLAYWAAGWGSGNALLGASIFAADGHLSGVGEFGAGLIQFWAGCVKLLAVGFVFSFFWSASAAIYLLLRRDVDAAEMDEVFLDADAAEQAAPAEPSPAPAPSESPANAAE